MLTILSSILIEIIERRSKTFSNTSPITSDKTTHSHISNILNVEGYSSSSRTKRVSSSYSISSTSSSSRSDRTRNSTTSRIKKQTFRKSRINREGSNSRVRRNRNRFKRNSSEKIHFLKTIRNSSRLTEN